MKKWLFFLIIPSLFGLDIPKDGEKVVPFSLPNQYGDPVTVSDQSRIILYIPDKKASEIAKDFLRGKSAEYVRNKKLTIVSDLSGVPAFVRTLYIIPDLRNYPFDMLVIEDEFSPVIFDAELGKVSVISLDSGRQKTVKKAATAREVEALIDSEDKKYGKDKKE